MEKKSFFLAFFLLSFFLVILPLLVIDLNNSLRLPVLGNFLLKAVGLPMILIGLTGYLFCFRVLMRIGRGTPMPIEPPKRLVVKGPYKFTRNPMYLAVFMIFLGEFFLFGHLLLLFYFLFSLPILHLYVIFGEEPRLKKSFGKDYATYINTVSRWILF